MYVALIQYPHFVPCVVVGPSVILSLVVPDLAPQKVPLPIQDESEDVSEWAHKSPRWFCKVDACTSFMWPNGCFVNTWSKDIPFECKQKNQGIHLFILGGLGNKITVL
jgi:hypothetical protein